MTYLFILSKDYLDIAQDELRSLCPKQKLKFQKEKVLAEGTLPLKALQKRLALTRSIHQVLFSCSKKVLDSKLKKYPWKKIYKKNFSVSIDKKEKLPLTKKDVAKIVWTSVNNPKVELQKSHTPIHLISLGEKVLVTKRLHASDYSIQQRKAHKKPFAYSSSLDPKLAKALINLLEVQKGTIVDPCCGSGGFLVEAGLMGLTVKGYDLYSKLIRGAAENLEFYKIRKYDVQTKDALTIKQKMNYIITDLPYGRNSSIFIEGERQNQNTSTTTFYNSFLEMLKKNLQKKAVLIFPHFANYKQLLKKHKIKIEKEYSVYIHKNLTRKIVKVSAF